MTAYKRHPEPGTAARAHADGLLLLDKKPGLTSFDSLAAVKKAFNTGKVGHTGTLDKFASGLLLVLVGKGLKLIPLFDKLQKEYEAVLFFGEETDTLDPEGSVIATAKVPSRGEVEAILDEFRGDILQSPPVYSALHIQGRRAYELAREGKEPEMKKRQVTVFELELLSWAPPAAQIRVRVSAGTYIRSLARDIALAAGSRAHLSALKRTRVGPFRLEEATEAKPEALRPLDENFFRALSIPQLFLDEKAEKDFIHGRPLEKIIAAERFPGAAAAAVFRKNEPPYLLGLAKHDKGIWSYGNVFANN
jgi:tRNA pseudouridine55 synthase